VANPLSSPVAVYVEIKGVSQTDPTVNFDIICGTVCVNAGTPIPSTLPVTIAAGTASTSFSFTQPIPANFLNNKLSFTASLFWGPAGTIPSTLSSVTKSGAFAVVS
jgi:hypothetical protein